MVQLGTRIEPCAVPRRAPTARVLITSTFLAGLLAILVARWWTGTGYVAAPAGLPDPGWVTAVGLPVAQYTHDIAAVTVAGLLFLRCAALPAPIGPGGATPARDGRPLGVALGRQHPHLDHPDRVGADRRPRR